MKPIGPKKASTLEAHLKNVVEMPDPLHFCKSYFHWEITSLADLTNAQARQLIDLGTKKMAEAKRDMAREASRS